MPNPKSEIRNIPAAPSLLVAADPHTDRELLRAAARLSVDLNLPLAPQGSADPATADAPLALVVTPRRLELRVLHGPQELTKGLPVTVHWETIDTTSPAGRSLKQPLLKACGIKARKDLPLTVIDATAGWGEDAWLLAALGCRVLAVERNAVLATLLRDGLLRLAAGQPEALARLRILHADGRHLLRRISRLDEAAVDHGPALDHDLESFLRPDVVLLDPMFPDHAARKTAERKPLRVLRTLVGDDADSGELLHWALRAARKRVVVKRPLRGAALSCAPRPTPAPTTQILAKALRFDVYVIPQGKTGNG